MSNIEKTGKKLIDSIRKTKEGSDTEAVKAEKKATTKKKPATATKKTTTKTTPKKPRATTAKKTTASKAKAAQKKPTTQATRAQITSMTVQDENPYPDGSQVWPD